MSKPGATKDAKPADDDARAVANAARAEIESKAGGPFATFEVTQVATQVVAGTNYFLKIKVGDGKFVHARVHRSLPPFTYSVHSVQTGKSESDELSHF